MREVTIVFNAPSDKVEWINEYYPTGDDNYTLVSKQMIDLADYLHSIDAEPEEQYVEYGQSLLQRAYPEFVIQEQIRKWRENF